MNRTLTICSLLLGTCALAAGLHLTTSPTPSSPPRIPAREAIEEDPRAREEWEWRRLRDPATGRIPDGIRRAEQLFSATLPSRGDAFLLKNSGVPGVVWQERGPANVGGRTRAVAIDAADSRVLLAGGITGGMWRSTNSGASWSRTTLPAEQPSVTCIAQDTRPGKTDIWYYGTGEFRTNSERFGNTPLRGDGIYKSTDGGRSWKPLPSTISGTPQTTDNPFDYVNNIVVDRSNTQQDELYAATYGAIMRSTDGGATWQATLGGPGNNTGFTTVTITETGVLYAGIGSGGPAKGLWRSEDGLTWSNITPTGWGENNRRILLDIAPSNPNLLYVLAETPGTGFEIQGSYGFREFYSFWKYTYVSGNGSGTGGTWVNRSENLPKMGGAWTFNGLNSYALLLEVAPTDENIVFIGGSNLYRSGNGFATSEQTKWLGGYMQQGGYTYDGALHPDQHTLLFAPENPAVVYVGNDGGVYRTNDHSVDPPYWTPLNDGYVTSQFYTLAIDPGSPGSSLLMGGLQDNGTAVTESSLRDDPWRSDFGGDGSFCAIAPGGATRYVSSQGAFIMRVRMDDAGAPMEYTRIDPEGGGPYLFINPFMLDPLDPNVMYLATRQSVWRNNRLNDIPFDSMFNKATEGWEQLTGTSGTGTVSALGVSSRAPEHRLYYGTAEGKVFRLDDVHQGMPAPVEITGKNFPAGAYVNCIAVDPQDGNRALVVFTNYNVQSLFLTADGGATWSAIGGNLEENPDGTGAGPSCRWGAFLRRGSQTHLFIATTTGLYSTAAPQGGETVWEREGNGTIGMTRVDMIQTRESDGLVAVATWGNGVFTATYPLASVENVAAGASPLRLEQNVPNPVRSATTIRFTVPATAERTNALLELYDAGGKLVKTLADAPLPTGTHEITFDLGSLPSDAVPAGTYYYRLQHGERTEMKKMVVVR